MLPEKLCILRKTSKKFVWQRKNKHRRYNRHTENIHIPKRNGNLWLENKKLQKNGRNFKNQVGEKSKMTGKKGFRELKAKEEAKDFLNVRGHW